MANNGGFTLGGVAASTYGITMLYSPSIPMISASEDRTASVLGRAGEIWIDSKIGTRSFSLPCQFRGCASPTALDTLIRAFGAVLVDVYGRPKQLKLVFDDSPSYYYTVRYDGSIPFDREWKGCSNFTLNLIADDPYAYEISTTTTSESVTTDPQSWQVVSDTVVSTPATICITNNGAASVSGIKITLDYEVDFD